MTHPLIARLRGLLQTPAEHWLVIREEYIPTVRIMLRKYYLPFLLAMIPTFLLASVLKGESLKRSLALGLITPTVLALAMIILFYLISLIAEETTELFGIPITPSMGIKLTFFSAFPFTVSLPLLPIPYLGPLLAGILFLYMFFLFYSGAEKILGLTGTKRFFWLLSVIVAAMLIFFLLATVLLVLSFLANLAF